MLAVVVPHGDDTRREISAVAEDMATLYDYWNRKRQGRRMPSRRDLDPAEMVHHLPGVMLVDVVADDRRFVYRLVGTREVSMRGRDPTGKSVVDEFFAESAEFSVACYQDLVRRATPVIYKNREFTTPDGRFGREHTVLLPLSDDGVNVTMILVYTHHMFGDLRARAAN